MSNQYPKKAVTAGKVRISENVVRSIAGVAAREIEGVEELAAGKRGLFPAPAPVSVAISGDTVEITVRLILKSTARLQIVAEQVQQNVKESVQSMTGVVVSKVHVIADDIVFED